MIGYIVFFLICLTPTIWSDGKKDYGEPCSLRSQIANIFRENDSAEGCISSKGLICVSHKCVCADPSNIYEDLSNSEGGSTTDKILNKLNPTKLADSAKKAVTNFFAGTTSSTTVAPPVSTGRCVGRAGSPCFTGGNSTCVKHAKCEGTVPLCRCQGIYSTNTTGFCSKSQSVINQGFKSIIGK